MQMKQLIVQLHAHRINQPIPYTWSESALKAALDSFEVEELTADTLYAVVDKIAELDGLPFKKA